MLHFSVRKDELGQKYLEFVVRFDQMVFVLILLLLLLLLLLLVVVVVVVIVSESRDCSVGISTEQQGIVVPSPSGAQGFFLYLNVLTSSVSHAVSCFMGTGGSVVGIKQVIDKLTTRLHLVPRLRITGAVLPRLHVPSWREQELSVLLYCRAVKLAVH